LDREADGTDRAAVHGGDRAHDLEEHTAAARAATTAVDAHAGAAAEPARDGRRPARLDQPADDALLARVDDGAVGADVVEEAGLRLDVAPEGAVVVRVLEGRDAGEDAEGEVEAVDAVLDEPLAGHLHGAYG